MKAKITFVSDFFCSPDEAESVTVYGQNRKALIELAYALEKSDGVVVTNLFITDDEVKEKVESNS